MTSAKGKRTVELLTWLEGPTGKSYPSVHRVLRTLALYAVDSFSPTPPPKTVRSVAPPISYYYAE